MYIRVKSFTKCSNLVQSEPFQLQTVILRQTHFLLQKFLFFCKTKFSCKIKFPAKNCNSLQSVSVGEQLLHSGCLDWRSLLCHYRHHHRQTVWKWNLNHSFILDSYQWMLESALYSSWISKTRELYSAGLVRWLSYCFNTYPFITKEQKLENTKLDSVLLCETQMEKFERWTWTSQK